LLTVIVLALAASVCFAAGIVLQYHEAHQAPRQLFLSPRLLIELAHHRLWVGGIAFMAVGTALQGWSLAEGSLAVVEPLLTSSLLFALAMTAVWHRERLRRREWVGALMVSAGLGLLLGVGSPTLGRSDMPQYQWLMVSLATWGLALSLVAAGQRAPWPSYRAALIGAGSGVLFGLQDALTRWALHWASRDLPHLFLSWQTYVLAVTAVYGLTLMQSSYEAGRLTAALPPMTIAEPVVGILIGMLALNEQFNNSPTALAFEAFGALVMGCGTWLLARSPLVTGRRQNMLRRLEDRVLHHHDHEVEEDRSGAGATRSGGTSLIA